MKTITFTTAVFALISLSLFTPYNSIAQTGYLFGTTMGGGAYGNGTIFSYNLATRQEKVEVNFDSANGIEPLGNLTLDKSSGLLYGTTLEGGTYNKGILFAYTPVTGTDSNASIFNGLNGKWPTQGSVTEYNGAIYGMTGLGGANGFGVLYKYDPSTGNNTTLINFDTANGKEYDPMGSSLTFYPNNGLLYGMTYSGGSNGLGTIFTFDAVTGKDSVVVSLDSTKGFHSMEGTLTLNKNNGLLYGVTSDGGTYSNGVLFSYDPIRGNYKVLINFNDAISGSFPYGGLLMDTLNGLLYGMTYQGGTNELGVIFSFDPASGMQQVLVNFNDTTNGSTPTGSLTLGPDGKLYGLTLGDATGNGVLFCYDPVSAIDSVLFTFNYSGGSGPYGTLVYIPAPGIINPVIAGVQSISEQKNIAIYPNPFSTNTNVVINDDGTHYIELDDISGRRLNLIKFNGTQYSLSRIGLADGIYIVKLYDDQREFISESKIVVN
jgi:uncharacterized repeat protein (TIGR03803 family)